MGRHLEVPSPRASCLKDTVGNHHDKGADPQSDAYADGRRYHRVSGALEHEHLHQVYAARAYGPGHAHLSAPRSRQHDEYQEYQQYTNDDREEAHD